MIEEFLIGYVAGIITVPIFLKLILPKLLDKLEEIIQNQKRKRR